MMCADDVLTQLRDAFPGWDVVRAGGLWLATRDRVLTDVEMSYGLRHVLVAEAAGQLRVALATQHELTVRHMIKMSAPVDQA